MSPVKFPYRPLRESRPCPPMSNQVACVARMVTGAAGRHDFNLRDIAVPTGGPQSARSRADRIQTPEEKHHEPSQHLQPFADDGIGTCPGAYHLGRPAKITQRAG